MLIRSLSLLLLFRFRYAYIMNWYWLMGHCAATSAFCKPTTYCDKSRDPVDGLLTSWWSSASIISSGPSFRTSRFNSIDAGSPISITSHTSSFWFVVIGAGHLITANGSHWFTTLGIGSTCDDYVMPDFTNNSCMSVARSGAFSTRLHCSTICKCYNLQANAKVIGRAQIWNCHPSKNPK